MIAALPYLFSIASQFTRFATSSSISIFALGGVIKSQVDSYHSSINDVRTDNIASVQDLKIKFDSLKPIPDDTVSIGINPTTLPDYMSVQSDMTLALTEQMRNISNQLEHQSSISSESIRIKGETSAHLDSIATTLNSALPAMVLQLQEVTKLVGISSMKSEIDIAYNELALQNHDTLITTLQNLQLSAVLDAPAVNVTNVVDTPAVNVTNVVDTPAVNVTNVVDVPTVSNVVNVPDQSQAINDLRTATTAQTTELANIKTNLDSVSQNAIKQKEIADYMTSSKKLSDYDIGFNTEITLADGSVEISSHTPLEIHMMNSLKSHEISDYKTTPLNVYNFDGNLVTSYIKPIELEVVKNSVDAKNATDEMEFSIPDEILDEFIGSIPLPEFTYSDILERDKIINNTLSEAT